MKLIIKLLLIFALILFINSCQDTEEPQDVTNNMKLNVRVVDQSGNLLNEAEQVVATIISYDDANEVIMENPLKDYGSTVMIKRGVGLFYNEIDVPIMVKGAKLKIDAIANNSITNFVGGNQQTEIVSFCADTLVTFVFQKTQSILCNNANYNESVDFSSTQNASGGFTTDLKLTRLYTNTTGGQLRFVLNNDFNQLGNYGLNAFVIYNNDRFAISTLIANPNLILLQNNESFYIEFEYSPGAEQVYLELSSILNLNFALNDDLGNTCSDINFDLSIEAVTIADCACLPSSSTFYYAANPSATFPTICTIKERDTVEVLFNITNSSEECDLILEGVPSNQFGRLNWIDATGSNAYSNGIRIISISGDVTGGNYINFSLSPKEKVQLIKFEIETDKFNEGYYNLTSEYKIKLKNLQTNQIQNCPTSYFINLKLDIKDGDCEVLYDNVPVASDRNLFLYNGGSNTFDSFKGCLDKPNPNGVKHVYIRNTSVECAIEVNLNLDSDRRTQTNAIARQGIFSFNFENRSTRDLKVRVEPNQTIKIPIIFLPKFDDAFPNGRISPVEYNSFNSDLTITTEYSGIQCTEQITLLGEVDFEDCCQDNDKALRVYGQVDAITNTTYKNGLTLNLKQNFDTALESATSDNPTEDFGIFVQDILVNTNPTKRDPANLANPAPFEGVIFGNNYVSLTKICNLVENGTGNCVGTFDWATASFNEICDFRNGVIGEYLNLFDENSMPLLSSAPVTIYPGDLYLIYLIFENNDNVNNTITSKIFGVMYINKIQEVSDGVGNIVRTVEFKFAYPIN
jgi:hypothetical protein